MCMEFWSWVVRVFGAKGFEGGRWWRTARRAVNGGCGSVSVERLLGGGGETAGDDETECMRGMVEIRMEQRGSMYEI